MAKYKEVKVPTTPWCGQVWYLCAQREHVPNGPDEIVMWTETAISKPNARLGSCSMTLADCAEYAKGLAEIAKS